MSSIVTSTVRKTGLDHFEPDLSDDPQAQRKLRGHLERIDYTAFAANREMIAHSLGQADMAKFQRLALAAAHARASWVAEAVRISSASPTPSPDQIARLAQMRQAYEELSEVYEAMRRMVERSYLPFAGD
jgi:hypothetical protein